MTRILYLQAYQSKIGINGHTKYRVTALIAIAINASISRATPYLFTELWVLQISPAMRPNLVDSSLSSMLYVVLLFSN